MSIEQKLAEKNLLHEETRHVRLTSITTKVLKTKVKVTVEHTGNMGASLRTVNEQLRYLSGLDDTLAYLDSLGPTNKKQEGSPDYLWTGQWDYKRDSVEPMQAAIVDPAYANQGGLAAVVA